jgi:2-iminobutanoate/2-iminopropanoate deaminase
LKSFIPATVFFLTAALAVVASVGGAGAQDMGRKVIATPMAPNAIGPYSQGVQAGKTLYVSGEIAIDPKTNQFQANAPIDVQTRQVLDNIKAILAADGLTMDQIVSTTVYLTDIGEFDSMNKVYATYFKAAPPTRATVQVAHLARDAKIEISAIAVAP